MALPPVVFPTRPIVKIHLIINCVLVFLTLVVVVLRIVSRFITSADLGWDDYLILMATPEAVGMLVIQGLYTNMGVDYPITETLPNIVPLLKLMVSYALIYSFCISTVKISVLFFYLRVFVNERLRLATKIVMGFVASWTITNILLLLLICRPFKANYTPTLSTTHCGNQVQAFISIGAFNIISDVLICALPIPTIWSLTAKRKMKITLSGLFMIGLLVSAIAVGRIVALTHLDLNDITGTMVWVDFLSTTEVSLGILCVSLPMLGPLLRRYQSHRGASRFERTPDEDSSTPSNRRAPKFSGKKQPGSDTLILQSIDGYQDPSYSNFPSANVEISSRDGSEASLNPMAKPEASRTGS